MSRIAYVNGRYVDLRDARVHVEDRGYQFADGVYEVIYLTNGRWIDVDLHLARLARSLGEMALPMPMPRAALLQVLREVVRRNRLRDGLLYLQITRGVARREHAFPAASVPPGFVVTLRRTKPPPARAEGWAISAITHPDQRWARCDIKSTALLPNVLARQAARQAGAGEAILFDAEGRVTEGAATTVWLVDAVGRLRTRPLDRAILPGCTRDALITLLAKAGIGFEERGCSLDELRAAREVFLTSASGFVKPVLRIDGAAVGTGAVGALTQRLFALFAAHAQGWPANAA